MSKVHTATQTFQTGPILVILAAMLWGTTGTAQAFAPDGAHPAVVGAIRLLIGGAALLSFAWFRGSIRTGESWAFWPTAFAAAGVSAYQVLFFSGVAKTGVAIGTIVGIGSSPILAGILGYLIWREKPSNRWGVATLFAIAGAGLLLSAGKDIHIDIEGIILAIGAGATYAIYAAASKELLRYHPPDATMAVVFSLGAVLLLPILFFGDLTWITQPQGIIVALHLGLLATGLSYILFARGLRLVPVANAVTLSLAEPLTAGILGVFVLGEQLTLLATGGIILLFFGLALLSIRQRPYQRTAPLVD